MDNDRHILLYAPKCISAASLLAAQHHFTVQNCSMQSEALEELSSQAQRWSIILIITDNQPTISSIVEAAKSVPTAYCIVMSDTINGSPKLRLNCFAQGARMLAHDIRAVGDAIQLVAKQLDGRGCYTCHECGMQGLSEEAFHLHVPMYHSMEKVKQLDTIASCPICGSDRSSFFAGSFAVHLHNQHGPPEVREPLLLSLTKYTLPLPLLSSPLPLLCSEPAPMHRSMERGPGAGLRSLRCCALLGLSTCL